MSRTRNWVFTINNFSDVEQEACQKLECSYIVVGTEVGASGTPHLQGYVEFANAKTMTAVKKLLGGRAHLEPRKGTPLQASDYCKKMVCSLKEVTYLNRVREVIFMKLQTL